MQSSYRYIWRIAWPVMGASLAQNAVSLIDTVFLGLLGRTELAAGAIGVVLFMTIGFIGLGLGTGVQVLTAQSLGEGAYHPLAALLRQALWIGGGFGLFLTLALAWGARPVLTLLLHDPAVRETTITFLEGRSLELFPLMLFGVLRGFFSGSAQTRFILQANLLLALTNLGLNALFVLGLGWGLWGVITGSVLAQYIATAYFGVALRWQQYALRYTHSGYNWFRPLLRYAGPAILQNLVGMVGWLVFFLLIERRGALALASANIVRSLYSFSMLPTWAFSTAVGTLVGYFWGAKDPANLWASLRRAWQLSQGLNLLLAGLLAALSGFWVGLFTQDAPVATQARQDLYMIAISLVLMPGSALLIAAVVGVGRVLVAFLVEIVIISLYVAYAFVLDAAGASLTWLWSAEWVYWVPSAVVLGVILARRMRALQRVPFEVAP